jgi:hypothetical protein
MIYIWKFHELRYAYFSKDRKLDIYLLRESGESYEVGAAAGLVRVPVLYNNINTDFLYSF